MKFKYLGTAAAEGIPAVWCECEVCRKSREKGGRNIRTRCQAIIDDRLLIDFGPDSYMHSLQNGIDYTHINHCIITHNHGDHFYPLEFFGRHRYVAKLSDQCMLTLYGSQPSVEKFEEIIKKENELVRQYMDMKQINAFEPFEAEGFKITPLKASHEEACEPLFYAIEKDGRSVLYAHDSGYFCEETWDYIQHMDCTFDLVSLDCTLYRQDRRLHHMGIESCKEVRQRLLDTGKCDEHTIFCVNHFSHNGGATYDEMVAEAKEHGFEVPYDGMEIIL